MARELHDDLGGHMTGIGLLAQTLHGELAKAGSPLAARTQELIQSISDAHQHLRSVIRGLMPVEAVPEGLMAALDALAKQSEAASGIACRFECERPIRVEDPGTALHLFRIAQEAVHNAVRHAQPTQIVISLTRGAERLEIRVTDNGRGLGDIPAGHTGIGLASMQQRARLLGGDCVIQSRDGSGTAVMCWVPWPALAPRDTRTPPPPRTR